MATREKKLSIGRKQNTSSPLPSKGDLTNAAEPTVNANEAPPENSAVKASPSRPLAKKLANKNLPKKLAKKTMAIKLKPTVKKNARIKQKLMKSIINDTKKKLLKPPVKTVKKRKPKLVKNDKVEESAPPVLEPILPLDEELKKPNPKKKLGRPPRIDHYDKRIGDFDVEEDDIFYIPPNSNRRVYGRKIKSVEKLPFTGETIDDVMNDLTTLIKSTEKKEDSDILSVVSDTTSKSDSPKAKKVVKRKKKENIENTLSKLSPAQCKMIDMLDLNVANFKGLPTAKRRHSIEKFPFEALEADSNNRLSVFTNLPSCISPRTKTVPKIRQSIEGFGRRYKTRSDSPARMLRNGKQRKLKDLQLLDGLEVTHKRRKRNSEFSGSEVSKNSGYESDSSFSDLSSVTGTENTEQKEVEVKTEKTEECAKIKRSPSNASSTNAGNLTDTNSNLCVNKELEAEIKQENDVIETASVSPSSKVPEKSLILDIMKQTFNDTVLEEKDEKKLKSRNSKTKIEAVSTETFYAKPIEVKDEESQEVASKEFIEVQEDADEEKEEEPIVENQEMTEDKGGATEEVMEETAIVENGDSLVEPTIEETPENLAIKENILQALGLQSLKAANEAKLKSKEKVEQKTDLYTGTLKTVIKINRGEKKKGRSSMKMTLHKNRRHAEGENGVEDGNKTKDGPSTSWKHGGQSSDTAGAHRKSHYSNRSNMDGSSEHTSDGENVVQEGSTKALVIPEKASSFSIHPGRICKDECSYCFGKFGLFDTPCHIAQMKSVERQNKILAAEKHLTRDSCLCDACYRHVDRKANTPSYTNKSYKRNATVAPGPRQDHCHVLGCGKSATNVLRRKWIIKMRRSICEVINIDLDNPGLHSIPICDEHYSALEYLMVCAMCKRRLAKNHVHYLGTETQDLNAALIAEGIPLALTDKPVVCKLCKYFAAIILKPVEDRPDNSVTFFMEYKKRLLHFNDIVPMDEAAAEEPIVIPTKDNKIEKEPLKKKRKISKNQQLGEFHEIQPETDKPDQNRVPSTDSRPESPSDYMIDYNTLIPSIAMECGSDSESKKEPSKPTKKLHRPETVKQAVEISKTMKMKNDKSSDIAVQRLGSNPSISVRQLFPCEEDLPLQGHIEFGNVKERTPEGWEKCTSIIQYDMETKHLWQELQKPYGNQSSFLRHLILLEKYFRNGDLILAPNASHHSINYSESVTNRLRAYDNIPTNVDSIQPISMIPFNKPPKVTNGVVNTKEKATPVVPPTVNAANVPKSTPITISQLNSPPLIQAPVVSKTKTAAPPPGLISLHPGTNRPMAPVKVPQSQKIKFPITKNWRPNLIPIDPNKKTTERKAGLVQVISGGKPYHITLEDYKKMCAIKKSFELKQKRLLEGSGSKSVKVAYKSVVPVTPRKGLVISKSGSSPKNDLPESDSILEKLDKQVEKLECRLSENKAPLALPKIPKSLTVIPQTVARKPSRPSSPVLLITPKPKQIVNKS